MMNRVDAVLLIILALYGFIGYRRGLLAVAMDWLGLGAALLLALRLYSGAGVWLIARYGLYPALARVLAFLALVLVFRLLWAIGEGILWRRIPRSVRQSRVNRIAGIVPGLLQGAIVAALGLVALAAVPLPVVPHREIADSTIGSGLLRWGTAAEAAAQRWVGGALRDLITFHALPLREGERLDLPFTTSHAQPDPEAETAMLHLVNEERKQRGLATLHMDVRLRRVARQHSADMLARGYFAHDDPEGRDPFQRLTAAGIPYQAAGENIAFAPTVTIAHTGLMNSPGHRANILRPGFHRAGIGILRAPPFGLMITQEFTN